MSSEYETLLEFGICQERWFSKSARIRNKRSRRIKVVGFAITSFVTVVLLMELPFSEIIAAILVWISSILNNYLDESQIKAFGLAERLVAERLRLINAQFSAGVISEEKYNSMLIDALNNQVVKYEQITEDMKSKNNK